MRKTESNVKYHLICNDIGWKQKTKKCQAWNIKSNITNTGRKKKINLTIFKFNAASKTNSNLLSDVMRTDTNYLMNAIKKHVKNWTPPLTPFWLFGLIKMFSAILIKLRPVTKSNYLLVPRFETVICFIQSSCSLIRFINRTRSFGWSKWLYQDIHLR